MTTVDDTRREPRNVVEEVRAARAAVSAQAGGFAGLGEYLRKVQEEYLTRTGRFAEVPAERPEDVQRLIDAADTGDPLLDDIRAVRSGSGRSE
ncbi:MAG: hypothetical protein V2A79_16715 [Planctomycetota bacterium]